VHGIGYAGPLGKAVSAREIGPDAAHLVRIAGPRPGWGGLFGHGHGPHEWGHDGDGPMMHGPGGPDGAPPPPPPSGN